MSKFIIKPKLRKFDFESIVLSHGWIFLEPFSWDIKRRSLKRRDKLHNGTVVEYIIKENKSKNSLEINTNVSLAEQERQEVKSDITYMLRLNEGLMEFHKKCREHKALKYVSQTGAGRMVRSPFAFEDIVKTMCTTNTSWNNTKRMVENLVNEVGKGVFPRVADILKYNHDKFKKLGLGYRADYILNLCRLIDDGKVILPERQEKNNSIYEKILRLREVKGIGEYSVNHILTLLGVYSVIPIDSDVRKYFSQYIFIKCSKVTDDMINNYYSTWGKWKFLAYKFERMGRRSNYINTQNNES